MPDMDVGFWEANPFAVGDAAFLVGVIGCFFGEGGGGRDMLTGGAACAAVCPADCA